MANKKILYLINPRGFCPGVKRAVATVEKALALYNRPVFVYHQIVHNEKVISGLKAKGAIFVNSLKSVPSGGVIIFSAHGISPKVRKEAESRRLKIVDATCPLVAKIHFEAVKYYKAGYNILLIGKNGHQEVKGILGEAPITLVESIADLKKVKLPKNKKIMCLTQTTFIKEKRDEIINKLKQLNYKICQPLLDDICPTTRLRQDAIKQFSTNLDMLMVIGSRMSNNALNLVNTAKTRGFRSTLIWSLGQINRDISDTMNIIGLTASASTPEMQIDEIIFKIKKLMPDIVIKELKSLEKNYNFLLPI